jgi:polyferredoxin
MVRRKKKKTPTSWIVWLRRGVQAIFLLLFFVLFLQTTYYPIDRVGGPVTFFFELDPLVLIVTWLAAEVVPKALLLSLVVLVVTLLLGRWFCGWVCPFGVFHNIFTSLRGGSAKLKLLKGGYRPGQKWKYYFLIVFLVGALSGFNVVGWLDPFSLFYRSLATAIYPALNAGTQQLFTWLYATDPGVMGLQVTSVSEPVYEVLREYFLAVEQPQYAWGVAIGLIFFGIVALNFYRARFWCRYLCPLGALLGLVGKNPLVRLKRNEDLCNDCRLCVADCPGGADPDSTKGWRPAECFFCWNCKSNCPHSAINFGFQVPGKEGHEKAAG